MKKRLRFCAILLLLSCLVLIPSHKPTDTDSVQIVFLDVGQGDCTLLRTKEGDVLIDAGPDDCEELLCIRLKELGVKELSLAVFSHPDEDHLGGADGIVKAFPTAKIWLSDSFTEDIECCRRLLSAIDEDKTEVEYQTFGGITQIGGVVFTVIYPILSAQASGGGNEGSLAVKVVYGDVSLLFPGDVTAEGEENMLSYCGATQLKSNLLKVAHHGSNTSTSVSFLEAVDPDYAVIFCGAGNAFGHPHGVTLDRLEQQRTTILRTDLLGELRFTTDGKNLTYVGD